MGWGENDRGVSFTFGAEVVAKFLHKHDFDLICRAHQVVEDGYEFFAKRQLVTLFSAPNYCGEFDNAGAMMSVDETLMCSFQILKVALLFIFFCLILGKDLVACLLGPFDENFEGTAKMVNTIHKFKRAPAFSKCLKNH